MSTAWLQDLEERVHEAATRLGELQAENQRLEARVRELEEQTEGAEEASAWAEERQEIQDRVGRLVEHLEGLLKDD